MIWISDFPRLPSAPVDLVFQSVVWEARPTLAERELRYFVRYDDTERKVWHAFVVEDGVEVELGPEPTLAAAKQRCAQHAEGVLDEATLGALGGAA